MTSLAVLAWESETALIGEVVKGRDTLGRRHRQGWQRFARVVGNNPGCAYEALVDPATAVLS